VSISPHILSAAPRRAAHAPQPAPLRVVLPAERPHVTRRRLGRVLAAVAAAAFTVAGLQPAAEGGAASDAARAVVGLAQGTFIGALLGISHRHRRDSMRAGIVGAAVAAALVLVRAGGWGAVPAPATLALAALAAAACAWTAARGARIGRGTSTSAPVTGFLAVDYPLMGLVYLCTPALWLLADAARDSAGAAAATCVALFGGSVLASVRVSRGPAARGGTAGTAALVAGWAVLSMAPLVAREPAATLTLVGLVTAVAGATGPWLGPTARERRFEQRALLRAGPALVGAFAIAVITPSSDPAPDGWETLLRLPTPDSALGAYAGLALVAGYAVAELRGRLEGRSAHTWDRLTALAVPLAAAAELARGAVLAGAPSVGRAALALAAARGGAALYRAYRDHAIALRRDGRAHRAVRGRPQVGGSPVR
jgi:hypothetical protein